MWKRWRRWVRILILLRDNNNIIIIIILWRVYPLLVPIPFWFYIQNMQNSGFCFCSHMCCMSIQNFALGESFLRWRDLSNGICRCCQFKKIQLSSPFGSEQEKGAMFNCQLHVMWRKSEFHLTCMNTGKTSRFSPVQSECEYIKQPLSCVSEQAPLFSERKGIFV